ncbi:MAG: hypoxanthine phosphoribosyltransferase [Parasporobacterium sp.]|nr:hypoxanthine phosphoribosyltransferase [Parasporobacterium sp.]
MNKIDVLIPEEDVRTRIQEMADEISEKYKDQEVIFIGILNGSVFFLTALAQLMTIPIEIDFMAASSYVGTDSTGKVLITKDLARSIEGKHILIIEDIVDTGQTLHLLKEMLEKRKPASLEIVTLLDKPERRKVEFQADLVGFSIPDRFVVGWGMDYNQKYRELPYIGIINE